MTADPTRGLLNACSGSFSARSVPQNRIFFQRDAVSRSNQALGRQDAGRWTARNPFRPDKFGDRIAIFVRHLAPPSRPIAPGAVSARWLAQRHHSISVFVRHPFLPIEQHVGGRSGVVCEAVHLLVNFSDKIMAPDGDGVTEART
jgi:hypothetical protein